MKKKIVIILASLIIIFFIIFKLTKAPVLTQSTYLSDNKEYKNIDSDKIYSIDINRYTEGGLNTKIVTDEEAKKLFFNLMNTKYGEETDMSCEDNTTVYVINFSDGTKKTIEIECDWIIIGKKRYMIVK